MTNSPTVGLIGCGKWGRYILRDLRILGSDVVVVARSTASRKRARDGGATRIVHTVAEMGDVDGVIVAVVASAHGKVIRDVIPLGVPIFVEKPMVVDPDEADVLVDAAGDRLFVMDKWRYHHGIEKLAELASAGTLGTITQVQTTRVGWGNAHPDVDTLWTYAPHDLAIVLEILGDLPPATAAIGEMLRGGIGDFMGFLGVGPIASVQISARRRDRTRSVRVLGTTAVAELTDGYADSVAVLSGSEVDAPIVEEIEISQEWPLLRELRAFVGHIEGGPPPRSSARDGALIVRRIAELRRLAGMDAG